MSAAASGTLVIESREDGGSDGASSGGSVIYAIFSFVLFYFAWKSGDVVFIVIAAFFALFGVAAIVITLRKNIGLAKFGHVTLTIQAPLPALGGHLHALIALPGAASEATRIEGRLTLQRIYTKGMAEDIKEDWAQVWQFPTQGRASALLFDIPSELPPVLEIGQGRLENTKWQLEITAKVPGVDFSRTFDIPMLPAQAAESNPPNVERRVPERPVVELGAAPELSDTEAATDPSAIATTILVNLLPIYGVVALGWKTADIVWIYWCENVVIGLAHVARLLMPQTVPMIMPKFAKAGLDLTPDQMLMAKGGLAVFFVMHYGGFCAVHAQFISGLFGARPPLGSLYFAATIVALLLAHLFALRRDIRDHGPRQVDLRYMMMRPYPRIFVVHVFLLVGGLALMHSQVTALIVFIAAKIGIDAYMQRKVRLMFDRRAA